MVYNARHFFTNLLKCTVYPFDVRSCFSEKYLQIIVLKQIDFQGNIIFPHKQKNGEIDFANKLICGSVDSTVILMDLQFAWCCKKQKRLYEDSQILILKNLFRLRFVFPVQCKSLGLMAIICILFAHERKAVLTT